MLTNKYPKTINALIKKRKNINVMIEKVDIERNV
jgi:hypothetical protein